MSKLLILLASLGGCVVGGDGDPAPTIVASHLPAPDVYLPDARLTADAIAGCVGVSGQYGTCTRASDACFPGNMLQTPTISVSYCDYPAWVCCAPW